MYFTMNMIKKQPIVAQRHWLVYKILGHWYYMLYLLRKFLCEAPASYNVRRYDALLGNVMRSYVSALKLNSGTHRSTVSVVLYPIMLH